MLDTINTKDDGRSIRDVVLQLYEAGDALDILKLISSTKDPSENKLHKMGNLEKLVNRIKRKSSYGSPLMRSTIKCCEEEEIIQRFVSSLLINKSVKEDPPQIRQEITSDLNEDVEESLEFEITDEINDQGSENKLVFIERDTSSWDPLTDEINDKGSENKLVFIERDTSSWDPLLLWFRPSNCCIDYITNQVNGENLRGIASIGCGSGLLEWLLCMITGIGVIGYEVNRDWWARPFGPPAFIPHVYVDEMKQIPNVPSTHALLFCYFNNGHIFRKYLSKYEGSLVIIIGPTCGLRHTDPLPLDLLDSSVWTLMSAHVQKCTGDIIACYSR